MAFHHSLVSCLVESLSLRKGAGNVPLGPGLEPAPCVALRLLVVALVLPAALVVELPAEFDRWCSVALISQCSCMRMPLMAALVCSISSLVRWLSLMTIMLVRPSSSMSVLAMRVTSSRRESCKVRRWWTCESNGGCVELLSLPCGTGGNEAGGRRKSGVGASFESR